MKFFALNTSAYGDSWVEIEINLIPGLPRFSIIGLPDTALKEGILRIKSALLAYGFEWPKNKEVIINLKPINSKKWNQNIELAILICFLHVTQQIKLKSSFNDDDSLLVLGDLNLMGQTTLSKDICARTFTNWKGKILTGCVLEPVLFDRYVIEHIGQLKNATLSFHKKTSLHEIINRPPSAHFLWTQEEARLISLLALGSFSALLAGVKGAGKTTLVKEVWRLLPAPNAHEFEEIGMQSQQCPVWRPLVFPHHTMPRVSLIGGGVPLKMGEVGRAHGGIMVLDEFLEFKKESIEVLREAMQSEEVEVSRLGQTHKFKTRFQALATTNLCPCGKWSGQEGHFVNCSRSLMTCKSYINRMIGPVMDRFHILWLKPYRTRGDAQTICSDDILRGLEEVRGWRAQRPWGDRACNKLLVSEVQGLLTKRWLKDIYVFEGQSERRQQAFWQVARALADLDMVERIGETHIREAYKWTCLDFGALL